MTITWVLILNRATGNYYSHLKTNRREKLRKQRPQAPKLGFIFSQQQNWDDKLPSFSPLEKM